MNRTAIAILRLINAATKLINPLDRRRYIREKIKSLSDEEKKALESVLKTMILMTSGSVETIRDPSLYDSSAGSWMGITSTSAMEVLNQIPNKKGGFGPGTDSPTMEDYKTAKKLMPIIGSSFMDVDEVRALTGDVKPEDEHLYKLDSVRGYETLYRGISNLKADTLKYATDNPTWDILRGVSTSFNIKEAENFAAMMQSSHGAKPGSGPSIFFTINNPKRKGFVADELSEYSEQEIILSGILDINSWTLEAKGVGQGKNSSLKYHDPSDKTFKYRATITKVQNSGTHLLELKTLSGQTMQTELLPGQLDKILDDSAIVIPNKFTFLPKDRDTIAVRIIQSTILIKIKATLR